MAVEVSEVELWASIVAGEHLIIVEDNGVHLVGVVELSALVFVDNQGQEGGALVLRPGLVSRSLLRSASILGDWLRIGALDSKLSEVADRFVRH